MLRGIQGMKARLRLYLKAGSLVGQHGFPKRVLWFQGGVGDLLLCTAIAREMRKRNNRGPWMATNHSDLFAGNSDFEAIIPHDEQSMNAVRFLGAQTLEPRYAPDIPGEDRQLNPGCHIIAKMCQLAGITGSVELKPYLHLSDTELAYGNMVERQIAIQSSNVGGRWPALTKQWYPERFQSVVDLLKSEFNFVQLGSQNDPAIEGAVDLRGKTTLRETAAILSSSIMLVGLEGMLMHMARAVECPSVIVYGARVLPSEIGYSANENLYVPMPCSPCWKYNSCEIDRECMQRISVDEVVAAIRRKSNHPTKPLVVDQAWIA